MKKQVNWYGLIAGAVIAAIAIFLLLAVFFGDELFPEYSPAERGAEVAQKAGCFSCHGVGVVDGSPNPALDTRETEFPSIPSLFEQRHSLEELREWIEDGISSEKRKSAAYQKALDERLLQMPAFDSHLTRAEIDDLMAYVALMQYEEAARNSSPVSRGEQLARRYACFTCHGPLGQGGVQNPGSLKGYIPGFFGQDFRALTENGDRNNVIEWIENGVSDSFLNTGFLGFYPGRFFTERQAIQMPAYKEVMSAEDTAILADFVLELLEQGPLDAQTLVAYRPFDGGSTAQIPADAQPSGAPSSEPLFAQASSILERSCVSCHGPEKQRSSYRLDIREQAFQGGEIADFMETPAVVPGDRSKGLLLPFVEAEEEDPDNEIYPMPPGKNPRLTAAEIELLAQWIEEGAPWPRDYQLREPPGEN